MKSRGLNPVGQPFQAVFIRLSYKKKRLSVITFRAVSLSDRQKCLSYKKKRLSMIAFWAIFIRQARMPVLRKGKGCQTTAFSFTEPQELSISLIPSCGSYGSCQPALHRCNSRN